MKKKSEKSKSSGHAIQRPKRVSRKDCTSLEVCILAGGLSSRMGRDKARVRFGGKTMLATIRAEASHLKVPVRVIRKDLVDRCGPLGGIYTGLKRARTAAVLFLACDMPFVTSGFLKRMRKALLPQDTALFVETEGPGFPAVLRKESLAMVEEQIKAKRFSIARLAERLQANLLRPAGKEAAQLVNLNTPEELGVARRHIKKKPQKSAGGRL